MIALRIILFVAGVAAAAWGAVLFLTFAIPFFPSGDLAPVWSAMGWLAAGPLVHDAILAPLLSLMAWGLARLLPASWRSPILAGTVSSGILVMLALPLLWRPHGAPPQPGLHDGNPAGGLLWSLAAVWVILAAWKILAVARAAISVRRTRISHRRARPLHTSHQDQQHSQESYRAAGDQ